MTQREGDDRHVVDCCRLVCTVGIRPPLCRDVTDHAVGDDIEDDALCPEQHVEVHDDDGDDDDNVECICD